MSRTTTTIAKAGAAFTLALLVALIAVPLDGAIPPADEPIAPGGPDLKTTLEKGLKARLPSEFDFIDRVVRLVNQGKIPESTVETTFLWARRRQPYPMPYFQKSMSIQAKLLGVRLPDMIGRGVPSVVRPVIRP